MAPALRRDVVTPAQLLDAGRALRKVAPRSAFADWRPPGERRDAVALVRSVERGRDPELIGLRHERMAASPFAFLRGAANVMAHDIAATPVTGVVHQICGDAHAANFGLYASPERAIVFDLNDFDETRPGPWEWDIARLAASLVLVGRASGHDAGDQRQAPLAAARAFRQQLRTLAQGSLIAPWIHITTIDGVIAALPVAADRALARQVVADAMKQTSRRAVSRFVEQVGGVPRFRDEPPLIGPVDGDEAVDVLAAVDGYLGTLPERAAAALSGYRAGAVGRKVVGVGSVGLRDYLILLQGIQPGDALVLQVKEAGPSLLDPYLPPAAGSGHDGRRVIDGQHLMQAVSDPLLGYTTIGGRAFYVRQYRDVKGTVDLTTISPGGLEQYALLCGTALALAHARAGAPALLGAYLGSATRFDLSMAVFAIGYADQTERDHAAFAAAL